MDEHSALLLSNGNGFYYGKIKSKLASSIKLVLKFTMWVIFITWAALVFLYPSEFFTEWYFGKYIPSTSGTLYSIPGSEFLAFSAPIVVIAFLAIAHLFISGKEEFQEDVSKQKLAELEF